MKGYSGCDNRTSSLLFGVKKEEPLFKSRLSMESHLKPFKSCTTTIEEHMVRHPECGDGRGKEHVPSSLLGCFKECHQHGRRRVDDGHMPLEEFEKVLDQIRYMYYRGPFRPIEKEDEGKVKQDEPKEKPTYGIRFYIAQPYQGKCDK